MQPLLALALVLSMARTCSGLSWPLCDSVGSTWVSSSPHLSGAFPYYQMLFFCTGSLSLDGGSGVDACINHGKDCGAPAADAYCQYLGYDGAVEDQTKVVDATEPVRAVTGEWCLSPGIYSDQEATNSAHLGARTEADRPPCPRIDALVCYRKRSSLASALVSLRARLGAAAAPAPAPGALAAATEALQAAAPAVELPLLARRLPVEGAATTRPVEAGGRKMLF